MPQTSRKTITPTEQRQDDLQENVTYTNRRLDKVEHEVNVLGTSMAALATEVRGLHNLQQEMATNIKQLIATNSGITASKGMVPVSYVTWGVSAFIALTALGLTMLGLLNGSIKDDITSQATKTEAEFERLNQLLDLRKDAIESKVGYIHEMHSSDMAHIKQRIDDVQKNMQECCISGRHRVAKNEN